MRSKSILVVVVLLFALPLAEATIEYNDGGTHDIDWTINQMVYVDYQSPGTKTTVNIIDKGEILDIMQACQNSRVNVIAGFVEDLRASENSQINISGGELGYGLRCYNNSQANISGGVFGENISASGNSEITILGGQTYNLGALDNAHIDIYDIEVADYIEVYEGGNIDIFGGTFNRLRATTAGAVTIYGSGFNYDLGEILHTGDRTEGHLSGTLANGDTIDSDFGITGDASIFLVPEPSTLILLGLGAMMVKRKHS